MFSVFQNITLAKKIIGGFAVFGVLFLLVVALSYYSATNSRSVIVEITQKIRPAVLLSAKLRETVESTSAAMGFYLLDKTDENKENYGRGLSKLNENLLALQRMPIIQSDPDSMNLLSAIEVKLKNLTKYKEKVLLYAQKDSENFPALPYSAKNINPISQQLLQNISMMILSEEEEEASIERKILLRDLGDLRYAASAIMGGIRAYLAFRNPASVEEVKLYRGQVKIVLARLYKSSEILTFEQEDGLEQFSELFETLEKNFKEMLVIHGGEDWRKDSYMLRTEIAPLISEIMLDIDKLVTQQANRANVASKKMMSDAKMINKMFIGVTITAIILIVLIVFSIYQYSIKPIRATVRALENISSGKGDLTRRLEVKANDEVGQLAKAFNQFVSRIQNIIAQSANVAENMSEGVNHLEEVSQKTSDGAITQQNETRLVSQSMG